MSLFSKKNLFATLDKQESSLNQASGGKNGGSNHRRKVQKKPRRFQIAESPLEIDAPVLGLKGHSSSAMDFLTNSPSSTTSLSFLTAPTSLSLTSDRSKLVDEALASSKLRTLTPDGPIEAAPKLGKRKLKAAKKYAKSLTKGSKWFNMAKVEITKEKKNDLEALKLRSVMDSSHHYKRNHMTHTPKYFHVGTIVETSAEFYSSRLTKKQRKKTLADEFAAEYGME